MIPPIIFFGSSRFSLHTAQTLETLGLTPSLIVTKPDSRQGRGLVLTPPEIKLWADKKRIPVIQPEKVKDAQEEIQKRKHHLFLVASFGKIIPSDLLLIPEHGWINIHPSLLPQYRGPSPIISQVLRGEKKVGVSIMLLDEKIDHGKIFAKKEIFLDTSLSTFTLEEKLAEVGANLFANVVEDVVSGKLSGEIQNESEATYTRKFTKEDGQLILSGNDEENYRIYLALGETIGTYFFITTKKGTTKRVIVKQATFKDALFTPTRVIPEGGKEMNYEDFLRGIAVAEKGGEW